MVYRKKTNRKTSFVLINVLLLISSLQAEQTKRFREGSLEDFLSGTQLPTTTNFVQSTTPTSSQSIKGTLYTAFNEEKSYLTFQVYYRNNSDNSPPSESLILEVNAPYRLDESFQNQTLLYSDEAVGSTSTAVA